MILLLDKYFHKKTVLGQKKEFCPENEQKLKRERDRMCKNDESKICSG